MTVPIKDVEVLRIVEQKRLFKKRTRASRNALGQFETPQDLSQEITQLVRKARSANPSKIRFLEPALGTGSFYSALLHTFPNEEIESASAYEIDETIAESARKIWGNNNVDIIQGDFTKKKPDEKRLANLIISNPPYVRHHHLSGEDKIRLKRLVKSLLEIEVSSLSGLYCYFVLLADRWLEEGGLAAWLLPAEFMDVGYGASLRSYLSSHVSLLRVHRFDPKDVQFEDALVSSAVILYKKIAPRPDIQIEFSFGGTLSSPKHSSNIVLSQLADTRKWGMSLFEPNPSPRTPNSVLPLSQIFDIKRGLATGCNRFFILPLAKAKAKDIPFQFLRPILPSPRNIERTTIEATDDGFPLLREKLVLLDCRLTEKEVKKQYPMLWSYFEQGTEEDIPNHFLNKNRDPWYAQEQRSPPPFLCSYIGRKSLGKGPFRFFLNKSQAVATNAYLLMYPKPFLKEMIKQNPQLSLDILEVLQSITDKTLTDAGRVYGGGLHKLEPSELAAVEAAALLKLTSLVKTSNGNQALVDAQ